MAKPAALIHRQLQWPTLAMIVGCYLGIALITLLADAASWWVAIPALSVCLALHSSVQHELLHGNPFKQQGINDALGFPAVGLFVPYQRFKTTHLAHHNDENLTDPHDDPETNYLDPIVWHRHPLWLRGVYRLNNTLAGRMLIGPVLGMSLFYRNDIQAMISGDRSIISAYAAHFAGIAVAAIWILGVAAWPMFAWVIASYGALSILRIRTFLEHQANEDVCKRTAIVASTGPLAWVFLFNNLHTVHHQHPRMPWYQLPSYYQKHQAHFHELNGHYHYNNYWQVFKHYFVRTKDPVPHPILANNGHRKNTDL